MRARGIALYRRRPGGMPAGRWRYDRNMLRHACGKARILRADS